MLEEAMEEVKERLERVQTKDDAKVQANFMAEGMMHRLGFFGLNFTQKQHTHNVTNQIFNDLQQNVDMGFSTNFHLYFLGKFLKYSVEAMQLSLLNDIFDLNNPENNPNLRLRGEGG